MKKDQTQLLTAEELSRVLNISEFTIKKLARMNQLPCEYVNRRPRFNLVTLMNYFRTLEEVTV